ncbi:hypothetical protein [Echinicola sp. 20G]|uniref:hypothetical protein n=1 Tax=Echinicola sp. 20G TaxID=2781961 RepID=UPI0019100E45|nr:hypothetical protein [Echinicola sp. 20G]
MSVKFNFKREFGWSDIIALLAFILAIIVAVHDFFPDKPELIKRNETLSSGVFEDSDGKVKAFGFSKAIITNDGNKPVTYLGIKKHERFGLIMTKDIDDTITENNTNINFLISDLPEDFTLEDINKSPYILKSIQNKGLEHLFFQNIKINPGESKIITLIVVFDIFNEIKPIQGIFFSPVLEFSDGSKLDMFGYLDFSDFSKLFKK